MNNLLIFFRKTVIYCTFFLMLNWILNWINFVQSSNIELNQIGYRTGLAGPLQVTYKAQSYVESWEGWSGFSGLIIEISDLKFRLLKYGIQEIRSLKYGIRGQRNHIRRTARVSPRGRCCCLRLTWVPLCSNPSSAPSNWLDLSFRSPCGQHPAIFYLFKIVGGIFSFLCWAF